jgi:hypothetical protein
MPSHGHEALTRLLGGDDDNGQGPRTSLARFIQSELSVLKERYLLSVDETLSDPVYEGMISGMSKFFACLERILKQAEKSIRAVERCAGEMESLSNVLAEEFGQIGLRDESILVDAQSTSMRIRECESVLGRFKRDFEYNILVPVRSHLENYSELKILIDVRNRKLAELSAAKSSTADQDVLLAMESQFESIDSDLFEWMYIIEEHREDILDSILQTLKFLFYEVISSLAHVVAETLPSEIEFRPMVEMIPKRMIAQSKLEKRLCADKADAVETATRQGLRNYTQRLMQKQALDLSSEASYISIDSLSLGTLVSQGFEEGPARRALQKARNNTQVALDILLNPNAIPSQESCGNVRIPSTIKRIERLKELRVKQKISTPSPTIATHDDSLI